MKRSAIQGKTPLRAVSPKKRKPKRAAKKDCRWRSEEYIAWVKRQPCCNCRQPSDDPHHVIGLGWGLSGMALTAPDSYAVGLCRGCHNEVHRDTVMQWLQPIWLMDTINAGLDAFPDGPIHDALLEARAFVIEKREDEQ